MGEYYIGLDIGTTNITLTALQAGATTAPKATSIPNPQRARDPSYAYTQDPHAIEAAARKLLAAVPGRIAAICVTGQVHGILYFDAAGLACSPLYTWL
ncbi:MAG TPA: hypothetical protein VFC80_07525, partial [Sphaerochaeta sp.]|nr:hypothetical protein [Sphaerochaeta sp.]